MLKIDVLAVKHFYDSDDITSTAYKHFFSVYKSHQIDSTSSVKRGLNVMETYVICYTLPSINIRAYGVQLWRSKHHAHLKTINTLIALFHYETRAPHYTPEACAFL